MFYLTDEKDEVISPRLPLPVDTMGAQKTVSASQTLTYNGKAVAGAVSVVGLENRNLFNPLGDRIGSYWGDPKNLVYSTVYENGRGIPGRGVASITETAGSADCVLNDTTNDLELLFESLTGTVKRYVLKATDTSNAVLYGWIMGVANGGANDYTFDIFNARLDESSQDWVGTLASFDNTSIQKVEIFAYQNSIAFGTGTTFTEEVDFPSGSTLSMESQLKAAMQLSNGQYFVDYMRGLLIGKRADTTASETVTYNVESSSITTSGTIVVDTEFPTAAAITDNFANPTTTSVMAMTMAWDGSAWDRMLGDSTNGLLVNLGTNNDVTTQNLSETTDSVAFYGSDDGGTTMRLIKTDSGGAIQVDLETSDIEIGAVELKDGTTDARQAVKVDNATASATPTVALIGAHYKATLDTYDDNDATPLHTDANGQLLITETSPASRAVTNAGTFAVQADCSATDLDIRDLANATDSVSIYGSDDGGTTKRIIKTDAGGAIQVDLEVSTVTKAPTSLASTTALAASLVAKGSSGTLYGVSGINNSASAQYIQVHNTASLPADTAVPVVVIKVDAGENFFYAPESPVTMSTGITISNSSTLATKTIGSADCWIQVEYL